MIHSSMMSIKEVLLDIRHDEQIAYIKEETRHINELLKDWFAQIGLRLIDSQIGILGFDKDGKTSILIFTR